MIHGPWKVLGDPCLDDSYHDSFNAQYGSVFKVPGKGLYIALGDRWMSGTSLQDAARGQMNSALARYVWLPLSFENGTPVIEWKDSWSPANYPNEEKIDPVKAMTMQMGAVAASVRKRKEEESQ